jgi:hypothetical protein
MVTPAGWNFVGGSKKKPRPLGARAHLGGLSVRRLYQCNVVETE